MTRAFVTLFPWVPGGLAILIAEGLGALSPRQALWALGAAALAKGCAVFLVHGGRRVTTLGVFDLSLGILVGYGGMHAAGQAALPVDLGHLLAAVCIGYFVGLCTTALAWRHEPTALAASPRGRDCTWLATAGLVALGVAFAARDLDTSGALYVFVDGTAFTAASLVLTGVVLRPKAGLPLHLLLAPLAVAVYVGPIHQGSGRLRVVALFFVLVVTVTARFRSALLKPGMLVGMPLSLWLLARERLNQQEARVAGASRGRTGLESMTDPIVVLGQVIEHVSQSGRPLGWGRTFLSVPFSVLPEGLLAGPAPIGYELVRIVNPSRYGTGFSLASTLYGEWVFNFHVVGVLLLVAPAAASLTWLDGRMSRAFRSLGDRASLVRCTFWVIVGASIADLAWSGLHTYGARVLSRLPLLAALWLVLAAGRRRSGTGLAPPRGTPGRGGPAGPPRRSATAQVTPPTGGPPPSPTLAGR